MNRDEIRRRLEARATANRRQLQSSWSPVPHRERTIRLEAYDPPYAPDELFPWTAVCLVSDGNRVLYIRDESHTALGWEPPGGKGEPTETPAETARREVHEETGVDCEITELLLVETLRFDYGGSESYPTTQAVFAGEYVDGEPRPREERIDAVRWFPVTDLPEGAQYRSVIDR